MIILSAADIAQDLGPAVSARFADPSYVLPAEDYLLHDFLPWFKKHLRREGLIYRTDIFDCDDFAREFATLLIRAGKALSVQAGIAVATLSVRNLTTSLGIPAGLHRLNLVATATTTGRTYHVIEPQTQLHTPLQNYRTADRLRADF